MKKFLILLVCAFLIEGCSKDGDGKPSKPKSKAEEAFFQTLRIEDLFSNEEFSVTNEAGHTVPNARILVGQAENDPFPNNLVQTDTFGKAKIPEAWQDAQPVTVYAPGYIAVTYLAQYPQSLSFKLKKAPSSVRMELKGQTTGYNVRDRDGQIDFGVIMKGMTKAEALAFDINKVISTEMDIIKVAGRDMSIPSNISLPRQRETYMLPITLEKNPYRLYFQEAGNHKVLGIRGKFPFKDVIDEFRNGKSFVDVLNYFNIEGGTLQDININITASKQTLDLNLGQVNFNASVPVMGPSVATGEVVVGVVGQDMNGVIMPTDVKKLTPGRSMNLKAMDANSAIVLRVLKREAEFDSSVSENTDRLSAVISKTQQGPIEFLNLIENPKLQGKDLILDRPQQIPNIEAYSTYLLLSELQEINVGNGKTIKVPLHRWEIYAPGWIAQMSLPQRPFSDMLTPKWRWEVSFLGGNGAAPALGPQLIEKTTHVTRSSLDF